MKRKLQSLLTKAGLSEGEVQVYLILLKLQCASVAKLCDVSGANVMTMYRTVKRLQERGLIEAEEVNLKECLFKPLSLQSLIKKIDKEQRSLRHLELELQGLDRMLPYMNLDHEGYSSFDEDPINVRDGLEAFREEYLRMPDVCGDEYLHIGDMENYWRVAELGYDAPEEKVFRDKRYRKGIFARIVNKRTEMSPEFLDRDSREQRTTRLLDFTPVKQDYLAIGKEHVAHFICNDESPRVIVIKQPELVQNYHNQFSHLWDMASA